jgi:hypothetical protein
VPQASEHHRLPARPLLNSWPQLGVSQNPRLLGSLARAPAAAGVMFAPSNLAVIAGSMAGGRGARRARPRMVAGLAVIAMGAVIAEIAMAGRSSVALVAAFVVMGAALGAASPAFSTPPRGRGVPWAPRRC